MFIFLSPSSNFHIIEILFLYLSVKHLYDYNPVFYIECYGLRSQSPITKDWHPKSKAIIKLLPFDEINSRFMDLAESIGQFNQVKL